MKIIGLKSYSTGYKGFIEQKDRYVFFLCYRNGKLKKLLDYKKEDYVCHEHFLGVISKFMPLSFFLKKPLYVQSITTAELDRFYLEAILKGDSRHN